MLLSRPPAKHWLSVVVLALSGFIHVLGDRCTDVPTSRCCPNGIKHLESKNTTIPMHPVDREALVNFRRAIGKHDGLLNNWYIDDPSSHPCDWSGVICDCCALYPADGLDFCDGIDTTYQHVYHLDFGPSKPSNKRLNGYLSPYLGNLTELRLAYLHVNEFSGEIPREMARLQKLQRLLLRDNQLTGPLPAELGSMLALKDLYFDVNKFEGAIPLEWCNLIKSVNSNKLIDINVVHPANNPSLCGPVPECLVKQGKLRTAHVVGTFLQVDDSVDNPGRVQGVCDLTPAVCRAEEGCGIRSETVIASLQEFSFEFPEFSDPDSGMRSYYWGIDMCDDETSCHDRDDAMAFTALTAFSYKTSDGLTMYRQQYKANGLALINGGWYKILLKGYNGAGPPLSTTISSRPFLVDSTPPLPSTIYDSQFCKEEDTARVDEVLEACWSDFVEAESSVVRYEYRVHKRRRDGESSEAVGEWKSVNKTAYTARTGRYAVSESGYRLEDGWVYFYEVRATNAAGLKSSSSSRGVLYSPTNQRLLLAIILSVIIPVVLLGCLGGWAYKRMEHYYQHVEQQERRRKHQMDSMKEIYDVLAFMPLPITGQVVPRLEVIGEEKEESEDGDETSDTASSLMDQRAEAVFTAENVTFVITDMESSTLLAETNPALFREILEIHDALVRQLVDEYSGYEVMSQGDSFELAFVEPSLAVCFCNALQTRLMKHEWDKRVLGLSGCEEMYDEHERLVYRGPRVRVGEHLARKGRDFTVRIHDITRDMVFEGEGYKIAQAIGNGAQGGQTLISQELFEAISFCSGLYKAGNPILHELGVYQVGGDSSSVKGTQVKLYQLSGPVWKLPTEPVRGFSGSLRGLHQVTEGRQLRVHPLEQSLSLARMNTTCVCLGVVGVPGSRRALAEAWMRETATLVAQSFRGHVMEGEGEEETFVVFPNPKYATHFAMTAQVVLLHSTLPFEGLPDLYKEEHGIDGQLLYAGPRVGMGMVTLEGMLRESEAALTEDLEGLMAGASRTRRLAHGGQVVLDEKSWKYMRNMMPSRCVGIDLGAHLLGGGASGSGEVQKLYEMSPSVLAGRWFPSIESERMVSRGYRESPDPKQGIAVMFLRLKEAASAGPEAEESWREGQEKIGQILRQALEEYGGYECKEAEAGKFTLVFDDLGMAMAFGLTVQKEWEALWEPWGKRREGEDEGRGKEEEQGRKSSLQVGLAYGTEAFRKPLVSGRADYFGALPNLAARIMSQAEGGQLLLEYEGAIAWMRKEGRELPGVGRNAVVEVDLKGEGGGRRRVELSVAGVYQLKGVERERVLAEPVLMPLEGEE